MNPQSDGSTVTDSLDKATLVKNLFSLVNQVPIITPLCLTSLSLYKGGGNSIVSCPDPFFYARAKGA